MARALTNPNAALPWVVGLSLLVHITAIAGVVFAQAWRPRSPPMRSSIPVELVRLGKPRDAKLLPRNYEPPPPPPSPAVVPLETKDPAPAPAPPKPAPPRELSAAAQRLLAGKPTPASRRADSTIRKLEEMEGQADGDVHGTTSDSAAAAQGYARVITSALKANYSLPETIPTSQRRFLSARVVLHIERNGTIQRFEFIQEHPNKLFMGALEKLLRTLQLPPPPAELQAALRHDGIEVIFNP